MKPDKTYHIVCHELIAGEEIKLHYHPKAIEWIVIESGKFLLQIGNRKEKIPLAYDETARVIRIDPGKPHFLKALSDLSYFVVRDREDKIVYVR